MNTAKTYKPATTDLSRYDNRWYKPGPRWKIIAWFLISPVFINSYLPIPVAFKRLVLRIFGAKIGSNVTIKPKVNIKYPWLLSVGSNVWIGEEVWIDNLTDIVIKNNVCISQGAMLLAGNHNYKSPTFDLEIGKILIEDGVWIGAKSVVCFGVTCGAHAVLTVSSVATKHLEPYGIYQGNPAQWVRTRTITA
jgi:putative colanic acid biosynthesis acetyltransferase WcaF